MYKDMFKFDRFEIWLEKQYPNDILTHVLKGKRLKLYPSVYKTYLQRFKQPDLFFAIIYCPVPSIHAKEMYTHSLQSLRKRLQERFMDMWPQYYAYVRQKKQARKRYLSHRKKRKISDGL